MPQRIAEECIGRYGVEATAIAHLAQIEHGFTHFRLRITPVVVTVLPRAGAEEPGRVWLTPEDALGAAIPVPVKRILIDADAGNERPVAGRDPEMKASRRAGRARVPCIRLPDCDLRLRARVADCFSVRFALQIVQTTTERVRRNSLSMARRSNAPLASSRACLNSISSGSTSASRQATQSPSSSWTGAGKRSAPNLSMIRSSSSFSD